jgi:hypothetical protein
MTNKEALSGANESSGECDWVPRRSKSQAEGSAAAAKSERAVADSQAGRLVKQQSR